MQISSDPRTPYLPAVVLPSTGVRRTFRSRKLLNAVALSVGDLLALGIPLTVAEQTLGAEYPWGGPLGTALVALVIWLSGARLLRLTPNWGVSAPQEVRGLSELLLLVFTSMAVLQLLKEPPILTGLLSLVLGCLLAWPLLIVTRAMVRHLLTRAGLWGIQVVIYGATSTGKRLASSLLSNPDYGYKPVGIYDDHPDSEHASVAGVPVLGSTLKFSTDVAVAVLAISGMAPEQQRRLIEGPLSVYETVVILPDLYESEWLWLDVRNFAGIAGLQLRQHLRDPLALGFKRLFDLLGTLLLGPLILSVCLLVALALWLETRTSPLFLQARVGLNGRIFIAWKFRTMLPDSEEVLRRLLAEDAELRAEWEASFKLRRDPRVTRLGALLRRTSLDELPQLLNVLLGDMSLVGPRPLPKYHLQELPPHVQALRMSVRPGMTGLWQVSGRSDAGNSGMARWDSYYVRNWSIWLDLVIMIRTVRVVFGGAGAY